MVAEIENKKRSKLDCKMHKNSLIYNICFSQCPSRLWSQAISLTSNGFFWSLKRPVQPRCSSLVSRRYQMPFVRECEGRFGAPSTRQEVSLCLQTKEQRTFSSRQAPNSFYSLVFVFDLSTIGNSSYARFVLDRTGKRKYL
jgi:hypothetical protein